MTDDDELPPAPVPVVLAGPLAPWHPTTALATAMNAARRP
jgi:hypothetical protein